MSIPASEYEITAIRSSGPGGQHVNKVSTAVQLRFDIRASSLSPKAQEQLLQYPDQRITKEGVVIIRASEHRSQAKNREEAIRKLHSLIQKATRKQKKRVATQPTQPSIERRLKSKSHRSEIKKMRRKVDD